MAKTPQRNQVQAASAPRESAWDARFLRSAWAAPLGGLFTLGLLALIFAPLNVWPLAFVCLVPWLVTVGLVDSARPVYYISYLLGAAYFCTTIYWLFLVTGIGAAVLFAIFAVHFPLIACPVRHIVRRRRWPLAFTFPFIWVGSEAVRSMFLLPFPWNLLGHSQHKLLAMIQVSDLVGAYGVSFVVAAVNGALADVLLHRWMRVGDAPMARWKPRYSVAFATIVLVGTLGYGFSQLHAGKETMRDGPKVAVVQGNYPNYVDAESRANSPSHAKRANRYLELVDQAADAAPELFLLPETPWYMVLNHAYLQTHDGDGNAGSWSQSCDRAFRNRAESYNAYFVTGATSVVTTPLSLRSNESRYNSAFVYPPNGDRPARYDKIHLVMIGEYVPFRFGPLRFIYLWINRIGPFYSDDFEYSLSPGDEFKTFEMTARDGEKYGFATPICYENVMPYISREFVLDDDGTKRCDFLLNLSNDGWFPHTSELPQHLAASVFRAVENRVGVARAVNTGISCFVDPDGRIHDPVEVGGRTVGPDVDGFRISNVRVDSRITLYSRYGDWFALTCAILWGLAYLDYVMTRSLSRRTRKEA